MALLIIVLALAWADRAHDQCGPEWSHSLYPERYCGQLLERTP